jgi:Zn finger protein HypA/HybF involved in hydrogenase expression
MTEYCQECGKELPDSSESFYCKECDKLLDKKFDEIEVNVAIYKELRDEEIETLNKFEKEDIIDFYSNMYKKFREDGELKKDEVRILNKIKSIFNLTDKDIKIKKSTAPEKKHSNIKKDNGLKCSKCGKQVKKEFKLCPYCGAKLKE